AWTGRVSRRWGDCYRGPSNLPPNALAGPKRHRSTRVSQATISPSVPGFLAVTGDEPHGDNLEVGRNVPPVLRRGVGWTGRRPRRHVACWAESKPPVREDLIARALARNPS